MGPPTTEDFSACDASCDLLFNRFGRGAAAARPRPGLGGGHLNYPAVSRGFFNHHLQDYCAPWGPHSYPLPGIGSVGLLQPL